MIRTKFAFLAIIVAALSTVLCPFLKVVLIKNWNMYQVDAGLFYITNGLLAILLVTVLTQKAKLFSFFSKTFFIWCLVAVAGVYFKTNNFFGMKFADGILSKAIQFKWGWIVLFFTAGLLLWSSKKIKPLNIS